MVAYLHYQRTGQHSCKLHHVKDRVAPLKPMTIPRLKLQAAVMGSHLTATLNRELDITIVSTIFWTDSSTVLCWLWSNTIRFKMFVANWVGEIEELVGVTNWRWISSKDNVADDATRDTPNVDLSRNSRWWNGPPFLCLLEQDWPKEDKEISVKKVDDISVELKKPTVFILYMCFEHALPDVSRFSSWLKLLRTTAWMFRFISGCRSEPRSVTKELQLSKIHEAEKT